VLSSGGGIVMTANAMTPIALGDVTIIDASPGDCRTVLVAAAANGKGATLFRRLALRQRADLTSHVRGSEG